MNPRRLPLRGVPNFRDLGGYPAAGGRHTRWNTLYRSGDLYKLNRADLKRLAELRLHTLADFRSAYERQQRPNRLPAKHEIELLALPVPTNGSSRGAEELARRVKRGDVRGLDADHILGQDYRIYVSEYTPAFRQYAHALLAAAGRPVLIHCTAGKDRTGFAAAITLRLLGVSHETILADYLLSNQYFLPSLRVQLQFLRLARGEQTAQFARDMATAQEAYLQAAFATIQVLYGSFEAYTRQGLGLQEEDVDKLQEYLLE